MRFDDVQRKLGDLRTLETELLTRHREETEYDRTVHGIQNGGPTTYGRAAETLSVLLDSLDEIVAECANAEAMAYAYGSMFPETETISIGFIRDILIENLTEDS